MNAIQAGANKVSIQLVVQQHQQQQQQQHQQLKSITPQVIIINQDFLNKQKYSSIINLNFK